MFFSKVYFLIFMTFFGFYGIETLKVGLIDQNIWKRNIQKELYKQKLKPLNFVDIERPNKKLSLMKQIYQAKSKLAFADGVRKVDLLMGGIDFALETVASDLGIPYYQMDTNHTASDSVEGKAGSVFSMSMPDQYFANATLAVLRYYNADKVAILTDETIDYRAFLQPFFSAEDLGVKVFNLHSKTNKKSFEQAVSDTLKKLRSRDYKHFVIRTNFEILPLILAKARYLAIVASPYKWYFPSTVCEDFGWSDYLEINTNFTFINEICDIEQKVLITLDERMAQLGVNAADRTGWSNNITQARQVLIRLPTENTALLDTDNVAATFNKQGKRINIHLEIATLAETGLLKIGGYWTNKEQSMTEIESTNTVGAWKSYDENDALHFHAPNMHNFSSNPMSDKTHYIIVGMEEHPFLIKYNQSGNHTNYKGFGIDLLEALKSRMNFTYEIYTVEEQGEEHADGTWSGMIGEILSGKASMAIGPLVQMTEREDVIDFSTSFKNREISLVITKPVSKITFAMFFQFLSPFDSRLWVCIAMTIGLLSFTLYFLESSSARFWSEETNFNMKECLWFIFCTAIQGGTESVPRSVPGRILTGAFYFFTLIMISSYTANLAAFLTVKNLASPIKDVEQLADPLILERFAFGTVNDSGVVEFFQHSKLPQMQQIYTLMTKVNPDWMVRHSSEGFQRVRTGYQGKDYVFIWDDAVNSYEVYIEDPACNLSVVGRPFGKRSYGIGVPQNSVYKEKLNKELLDMQAKNELENLIYRWWSENSKCNKGASPDNSAANKLNISEMAGVFMVLIGGTLVALLILLLERCIISCIRRHKLRSDTKPEDREIDTFNNHSNFPPTASAGYQLTTIAAAPNNDCKPESALLTKDRNTSV